MPGNSIVEQVSFLDGAGLRGRIVVACIPDEMAEQRKDVAVLLEWREGQWSSANHALLDTAVGMASAQDQDLCLVLGFWGNVYCLEGSAGHPEALPGAEQEVGPMRGLTFVGGQFYAVGMGRQAFVRASAGVWRPIDSRVRVDDPPLDAEGYPRPEGFEAVGGYSPSEIYAVGYWGEIWRFDAQNWHRESSPTNLLLTSICCAPDGKTYVGGKCGTLLCGRASRWTVVEQDLTDQEFTSLAWFGQRLFLASPAGLFVYQDDQFDRQDFGPLGAAVSSKLFVAEGVLWSVGPKDLLRFDGRTWERIA